MQLVLVFGGVALLLIAAAATVGYEDQREARRQARRRHERLVRLGEAEGPPATSSLASGLTSRLPGLLRRPPS